MNKKVFLVLGPVAMLTTGLAAIPASAAPAHVLPGEVVTVSGTPNLWITDDQGMIHFASDPQALTGLPVDWQDQANLDFSGLASLPHGDPLMTADFVKIGDSIYLPQWDSNSPLPTLRRIQSPDDLAQLGVDASNYGRFVLDQAAWEQRYNISLDRVEFGGDFDLVPPPPAPAPAPDVNSASDSSDS